MKTAVHLSFLVLVNAALSAYGQGTTFVYDQQSAVEGSGGGGPAFIQSNQPIGQSFTPTFTSVNFIRLKFYDGTPGNSLGATLAVNLRANSITGTILSSSTAATMADGFIGYTDFYFAVPVSLTPGTPYFFQPVIQSGDTTWRIDHYNYTYTGGTEYLQGSPNPSFNLWFREGLAVPEPSAAWLTFAGAALFAGFRRLASKRH